MKSHSLTFLLVYLYLVNGFGQVLWLDSLARGNNYEVDQETKHFQYFSVSEPDTTLKSKDLQNLDKYYLMNRSSRVKQYNKNSQQHDIVYIKEFGNNINCSLEDQIIDASTLQIKLGDKYYNNPFHSKNVQKNSDNYDFGSSVNYELVAKNGELIKGTYKKEPGQVNWEIRVLNCKTLKVDSMKIAQTLELSQGYYYVSEQSFTYFYSKRSVTSTVIYHHYFKNIQFNTVERKSIKESEAFQTDTTFYQLFEDSINSHAQRIYRLEQESRNANKDSLFQIYNRITPLELGLLGCDFMSKTGKNLLSVSPAIKTLQFNAYEGFTLTESISYDRRLTGNREFNCDMDFRYNIQNNRFFGQTAFDYLLIPSKYTYLRLSGGDYIEQINNKEPFVYSLFLLYFIESDYSSKVYNKRFLSVAVDSEPIDGLKTNFKVEWAERRDIPKTKNYPFKWNPLQKEYIENFLFENNISFTLEGGVSYSVDQEYRLLNNIRIKKENYAPTIFANYKLAVPGILKSSMDYSRIKAGVQQRINAKKLGYMDYNFAFDHFIHSNRTEVMDYVHHNSTRVFIYENRSIDDVFLLDYYELDNNGTNLSAHLNYNFNGFLVNYIPGVRRTKAAVQIGAHYINYGEDNYLEAALSLTRLMDIIRLDLAYGTLMTEKGIRLGARMGITL